MSIFFVILILFIFFGLYYIYYRFTCFTKEIEIIKKYKLKTDGYERVHIVDTNNIEYKIGFCLWKMGNQKNIVWDDIDVGQKYVVNGYGYSIPQLNIYPTIYEINYKVENGKYIIKANHL